MLILLWRFSVDIEVKTCTFVVRQYTPTPTAPATHNIPYVIMLKPNSQTCNCKIHVHTLYNCTYMWHLYVDWLRVTPSSRLCISVRRKREKKLFPAYARSVSFVVVAVSFVFFAKDTSFFSSFHSAFFPSCICNTRKKMPIVDVGTEFGCSSET